MKRMRQAEAGQVALLLVLIMTVVSVVVLSAVSGVVTNLRLESVDEESAQALRVAEAGVEEALRTLSGGQDTLEGISYDVTFQQEGIGGLVTSAVLPGEVVEVDVNSGRRPTSIDIYWGDRNSPAESPIGAVEVLRYQRVSASDYRVVHAAFDPNSGRAGTNRFAAATANPGSYLGVSFGARATIPIIARDRLVRVRVLYNQQKLAIVPRPSGTLFAKSPQSRVVSSAETEGGVTRTVEAVRVESALPLIFDSVLYSGGTIIQ